MPDPFDTGPFDTDVLICGAGATGLTLAVDLARRGVRFRLIDKADGPFAGSRGKGLQPRSLEIFEDLGLIDRLFAVGGSYPPERAHRPGGYDDVPVMTGAEPAPGEPYGRPLLVAQFMTEALLRERLAELGHAPAFGHALVAFTQDDAGVTARVAGPGGVIGLRARYLVGADGGRSTIRPALGIHFPGRSLDVRAIVADVVVEGLSADVWHRWGAQPMAMIALCPLRGSGLFQLQAPIPLEGEADLSAAGLSALLTGRSGRDDLRISRVSWASAYSMSARLADRYRSGRVFLAGDAAHIHPPTGGQGLNTSLQDAYNLGWKLAAVLAGAPDAVLDSYEAERRPVAAGVLGLSTGLLQAAQGQGSMKRGRATGQLDIGYPDSPLSLLSRRPAAALQPGDRAPDAPCTGASGRLLRLFTLFQGPHWTLLDYEPRRAFAPHAGLRILAIGPEGEVVDSGGHIQAAYDLQPGERILIRPDGHVAARLSAADDSVLTGYLNDLGLADRAVTDLAA